ncbi:hypothetical protein LY90DRAFT_392084 [Neocallimastix californiae]|jgi:peroxin-14|uniref:Peroxisomal membrane protein PEX14 n=1 Tax=Neocallimastix californiae TaxID=1754190 RepID=A0A1Y1ZYP3_9FUNG|nr:hypothetical protein LY90DRAFT_392084 [Neocallimastix californiae]|eukprot:ORY15366.1 hypothetical protein LY90DRAFT_392084 [Neocallimastix californiae]
MAIRENLVCSATSFLKDPKVQKAPLAKRVAFLESKGLTQEEIEEALSRANGNAPKSQSTAVIAGGAAPQLPPNPYMQIVQPPPKYLGWKDYFIGTAIIGGVSYALYRALKKYLPDLLQIPSTKDLQENNEELSKQLEVASEALNSSKVETQAAIKLMDEQGEKIKNFMDTLTKSLNGLKEADEKRDEEIRTIKNDLENVKTLIPKMIEKSKETNDSVLQDLQNEIKSLKSLIVNRMSINNQTTGSTSSLNGEVKPNEVKKTNEVDSSMTQRFSFLSQKPAIPAWQMQGSSSSNNEETEEKTNE